MDENDVRMRVLNGLTELIVHHARLTAAEQHAPTRVADSMDDYIEEHKRWVKELRDIRKRFEDLITGIIE